MPRNLEVKYMAMITNSTKEKFGNNMTTNEAKALAEAAEKCNGTILEIGAYKGFSTILLAKSSKPTAHIITIDTFNGCPIHGKSKSVLKEFKHNIQNSGISKKITAIIKPSANFYNPKLELDMLFIDGCHEYDCVKNDIKWLKNVKPGGIIAIHDTILFKGPRTIANDMIYGKLKNAKCIDGLTIAEKITDTSLTKGLKVRTTRQLYLIGKKYKPNRIIKIIGVKILRKLMK